MTQKSTDHFYVFDITTKKNEPVVIMSCPGCIVSFHRRNKHIDNESNEFPKGRTITRLINTRFCPKRVMAAEGAAHEPNCLGGQI